MKRSIFCITSMILCGTVCCFAEMRTWTTKDGEKVEAEYKAVVGGNVILQKEQRGKQLKVPLESLIEEDQKYVALAEPPQLNISFSKSIEKRPWPIYEYTAESLQRWTPTYYDAVFGFSVVKESANPYEFPLTATVYVFAEEIDGDNYVLLSKFTPEPFTLTEENNERFEYWDSQAVAMEDYICTYGLSNKRRGEKYGGYLIVIRDVQGEIIAHESPYKWVFENLETLDKLPVGKHMDKTCQRVGPPRPTRY